MSKFTLNGKGCIVFPQTNERVKARTTLMDAEVSFARYMIDKAAHTDKPEYYGELSHRAIDNISQYEV